MTKIEQIQKDFKGIKGLIDLYIDGVTFNYIDVDNDIIKGMKMVKYNDGHDYEDTDTSLSYELKYMDDYDFEYLIKELNKLK